MLTLEGMKNLVLRTKYCSRYGLLDYKEGIGGTYLFKLKFPKIDYNYNIMLEVNQVKRGIRLCARIGMARPDNEFYDLINQYNINNRYKAYYCEGNECFYIDGFYCGEATSEEFINLFDEFMDTLDCDYNGNIRKLVRKGVSQYA